MNWEALSAKFEKERPDEFAIIAPIFEDADPEVNSALANFVEMASAMNENGVRTTSTDDPDRVRVHVPEEWIIIDNQIGVDGYIEFSTIGLDVDDSLMAQNWDALVAALKVAGVSPIAITEIDAIWQNLGPDGDIDEQLECLEMMGKYLADSFEDAMIKDIIEGNDAPTATR